MDSIYVPSYSYFNVQSTAAAGIYLIKPAPGVLHLLCMNTYIINTYFTLYDWTYAAASGNAIARINTPNALLEQGPDSAFYDIAFTNGLVLSMAVACCDVTIAYR